MVVGRPIGCLAILLAGCYSVRPADCRVRCGDGDGCPSGMTCLDDGYCHESEAEERCEAVADGDAEPEDRPPTDAPPRPDGGPAADAIPLPDAPPGCGNGVVEIGESCDDGNADDLDACVRCSPARCGDGVVRARFEQCDDGNLGQDDGCTTLCLSCGAANQVAGSGGHCYTRHDAPLAFDAASQGCGFGYLMVNGTRASQSTVFQAILAGTTGPYWIGLHDGRVEGTFEHVNFAALGYTDWNPGQPDNVSGQDCVGLAVSTANWYDYDCATLRKYACEDDGAWIFGPDGRGYRVVWARATWDEAAAACVALGGQLAALETEAENALVTPALPEDTRIHAWIGADDRVQEGSFAWASGEVFSYHDFAIGQPNGDGDCVAISPGLGGWSDVDCATKRPYVCEVR